jgi:hypothetical protein
MQITDRRQVKIQMNFFNSNKQEYIQSSDLIYRNMNEVEFLNYLDLLRLKKNYTEVKGNWEEKEIQIYARTRF